MKRMIEVTRVGVEEIAMRLPQAPANIDDVEPRPGRQFECDLDWRNCHQVLANKCNVFVLCNAKHNRNL